MTPIACRSTTKWDVSVISLDMNESAYYHRILQIYKLKSHYNALISIQGLNLAN